MQLVRPIRHGQDDGGANATYGVEGSSSSTSTTAAGVYGSAKNYGVEGVSSGSAGAGGYFTSGSGYALITGTGNVGIGTTTPASALQVNGGVTVGNDAQSCTSSNAGEMIWTGSYFEYCNGSNWQAKGLIGKLTMVGDISSCDWTETSSTWTTFTTSASSCNTATVTGAAEVPSEGKIPAIKFASLPPGNYEVMVNIATMYGTSSSNDCNFRLYDGTNFSGNVFSEDEDESHMIGQFSYATPQTNIEFYVQAATSVGSNTCEVDMTLANSYMEIWVVGI